MNAKEADVLEQRARALAQVVDQEQAEDLIMVVTFVVGGRKYGVEARYVREVLQQAEVSRVPWAPPALLGVTNLRGEILAVGDPGSLLGTTTPTLPGPLIVLAGDLPLGLLVEDVADLVTLRAEAVGEPPEDNGGANRSLVLGVSSAAVLLDAPALLDDHRLRTTDDRSADGNHSA